MKHPPVTGRRPWLCALLSFVLTLTALAQPSGGPYGPQPRTYTVPADARQVYYVAPDGKADAKGQEIGAPTTLASAIERVVTGDAIIMRGGVYRTGSLYLNQGITIQPYGDEQVIIKGTEVATEWEPLREGIWRTSWKKLFPMAPESWWRRHREGMRTPLHKFNNDMVFINGRPLRSVGWEGELDANSFFIDYQNGHVFIRQDPKDKVVEITAHNGGLIRVRNEVHGKASDKKGYTLRGLTFTQYAYRALEIEGHDPEGPEKEAQFGKDVIGSTLEDVTITHCSRVAGYFRGDFFKMKNCLVSDTSTEGVYLLASSDALLEKNIFARNNVEGITGYYPSAVKIFNQTHRVVCRDNLVIDNPDSNGIWYDVGNVDGVFVNNWIENCLDGFFYEISRDVLVAGNVFVNCDKGVRILNAAGARIYHNTFYNATPSIERTERSAVGDHFGWHPATGPDVAERDRHIFVGNVVTSSPDYDMALLRTEQSPKIAQKLLKQQFNAMDRNVYVRPAGSKEALFDWAPATEEKINTSFATLAELRALAPQYEEHSRFHTGPLTGLFRSVDLKRFDLTRDTGVTVEPVAEVIEALGWPKQATYLPGAYQAK